MTDPSRSTALREFHAGYVRLMADRDAWEGYVAERQEWVDADLADFPEES